MIPLIEDVIEWFTVDRVLFGGDWPVLELAAKYREWVDVADHATRCLSRVDQRKVFHDNAINTYRLSF